VQHKAVCKSSKVTLLPQELREEEWQTVYSVYIPYILYRLYE